MTKTMRTILFLIAFIQFGFAVGFFFQLPFAVNVWPYEGTTPLTFIFIGSISAAAAASTFWAVASETYGALVGIALDYMAIMLPVGIFSLQLSSASGGSKYALLGIVFLLAALFGLALLLWSPRYPIPATPRMPGLVRGSFVVFVIALIIVASRLVLKMPNSIPWKITPELSVVIGWMFFGAAAYFIFALLRPSWHNAAGQLAGFLAYDLVLIVPFLQRLPTVPADQRVGMYVYTAIVIYSGLLAFYYLFIHPETRVWHARIKSQPTTYREVMQ